MRAFTRVTAVAAVLDRPDVDTDQIMPKQFLKRIERTGFGQFLFHDWRRDPDFELNRPEAAGARILIAGRNFGCGSSREHAPWGLQDYGFDVVVAPSYGDIFRQNCVQIGLVPIVLPADEVKRLGAYAGRELTVDLELRTIVDPEGGSVDFPFDEHERHRLLNGLDDIGLTLACDAEIAAFESQHPAPISTLA
ncbi:MAG: 3-isopropylmalate dehydratase small subunit [Actinobacteria bacterium]|nr:3-isopropylmalate dehydratase small subunit [Actinomycetota bacterium]